MAGANDPCRPQEGPGPVIPITNLSTNHGQLVHHWIPTDYHFRKGHTVERQAVMSTSPVKIHQKQKRNASLDQLQNFLCKRKFSGRLYSRLFKISRDPSKCFAGVLI
ncbi:hypothetical protein HAX54_005150 [Datura stramonium]|uniref:Uncharacterized protein n=1 Tax=Datura stramonium TaxID=4076 RepID=A0ABS8T9B8_DATST|nr:hypothetical protein [Datura stramonium]